VSVVALPVRPQPVVLVLPRPPSANALWRSRKGEDGVVRVVLSSRYRAWKLEAGWTIKTQPWRLVRGPYCLSILADRPDNRKRDLGNLEKAISDLLQAHGIIEGDHLAKIITTRWSDRAPGKGAKVYVTVEEAL